ncbi:hypothetical protein CSE6_004_02050 [Comamonas sp. E6]|nr:hypothetical protein CSE6_004_02050 [Comamonas sp. E6]
MRKRCSVAAVAEQVPAEEPLLTVTGDGAYDTQSVHAAVIQRNATPIIPPKKECQGAQRRWLCAPQRSYRRMQTIGVKYLETLERLPPAQPGKDQDELHQTPG